MLGCPGPPTACQTLSWVYPWHGSTQAAADLLFEVTVHASQASGNVHEALQRQPTERSSPSKRCIEAGPSRGSSSPSRAGPSMVLASGLFRSHSRRVFLTWRHRRTCEGDGHCWLQSTSQVTRGGKDNSIAPLLEVPLGPT